MRVLFSCSIGGAGHLNPLRPFIDSFQDRGEEVLVVVPPAMEPMVTACGYPVLVGGEPPDEDVAAIREVIATGRAAEASLLAERELFGRLCTGAMLPAMEAAFETWMPELVLRETCEYSAAVLACRSGVRQAQVAISQGDIEASALGVAAPALRSYDAGVVEEIRGAPYLTRFPASLDPTKYLDTRRFREQVSPRGDPLPKWWADDALPLVYVTFGSVAGYMSTAAEVYMTALEAVSELEVRVLLTVGRATDIDALGAVPSNVHVEYWVPQEDVLPHASLVVCHGGSGTAFGALAAGLPLVVVPLFADQFRNGRRIAEAGAGLLVEHASAEGNTRIRPGDARRVADAIENVLVRPAYSEAARRIAREMASHPSVEELLAGLR